MHKSRGIKSESCLVIMGLDSRTNLDLFHKVPFFGPRSTYVPSVVAPQPTVDGDTGPVHLFDHDE